MTDIVDFLMARYAEEDIEVRSALRAHDADPQADSQDAYVHSDMGSSGDPIIALGPRRALAELEAKAMIVTMAQGHISQHRARNQPRWIAVEITRYHLERQLCEVRACVAKDALQALVQPYAEHEDFDPAWLWSNR